MPRSWLIALTGLVVVPWLIVAGVYFGEAPLAPASHRAAITPTIGAEPGPWGSLTVTPIVISPPLEYVSTDDGPDGPPRWYFPGASPDQVQALLVSSGLEVSTAARIRATLRPEPRLAGVVASPDPEVVRALSPEARARVYGLLASVPYNAPQAHSYRFLGGSVDRWLDGTLMRPATRALVEPLMYRDGAVWHFADLGLVEAGLGDDEERRRLRKTLLRQSTVLVRLGVDAADEVGGLAEYWGRGGRKTDLRPLLESVAGAGPDGSIDVVHLLPAFARNFLYRYPKLTAADFDKPVIANCLWTALNFFEPHPDSRFLDVGHALETLKTDYYVVESGFQLGDVVAFLDAEGDLYHAAVYLADDLLLTKNGTSPMAPWLILPTEQVVDYYRSRAA
ncbi:MAG TPA: hypothetical protein VMM93_07000, partial [Vicinamibacterales bacterium]|nr:hypothetical protein [Vicinamibacterales bacterium]